MEWESQHPSGPSTPNSLSSQSTGYNNPARNDKIPALKQLSPSPSVTALTKLSDDDLRRKGKEDLLVMLRRIEADYKSMHGEHGNVINDVNRRYQIFMVESRNLKEVNQQLQDDNQELRDLCCFLDDDRQVGRKLAREWQRFGRYTASVMRSEVAVYQEKLRELEQGQSELVTENMELKELCLFLDQERTRITGDRDEGDGSSNGTTTGHEDGIISNEANGSNAPTHTNTTSLSTGSSNYLRELEQKVLRLEEEKRVLAQRINKNRFEGGDGSHLSSNDNTLIQDNGMDEDSFLHGSGTGLTNTSKSLDTKKPDSVMHAMKVLQVHEELEKVPSKDENWDDTEKAILREMCNVVWRKLGDVGDVGSFNESSDSILDPPPSIPQSSIIPGMQGQSQSFSLPQPQPQMASTPLSSTTKVSSATYTTDSSSVPQALYQSQSKKAWLPQADQRVDVYSTRPKDQVVTADSRPLSPVKKREMDRVVHNDFDRQSKSNFMSNPQQPSDQEYHPQPYSVTQKHFQSSLPEDEKIPPHFLPHSRQHTSQFSRQQQQPIPHTATHSRMPQSKFNQHNMQPQHPPYSNNRQKTFTSPSHDLSSQPHGVTGSISSSSALNSIPSHSKTSSYPHSNQQPLTSSQQYPHHPVRLLDAPGVRQLSKHDPRTASKDDYYSSQKLQKSNAHHPQMMYQRRDDTRSEPNISQSGKGNDNAGPFENHNRSARACMEQGHEPKQDHFPNPPHSRYTSDSSQVQQGLASFPSSRPNHSHYQDSVPPHHYTNVHSGGYSNAYGPTAAKTQHPASRPNQVMQKTPIMARLNPHGIPGGGRAPQRKTSGTNHYNDYDSDSL